MFYTKLKTYQINNNLKKYINQHDDFNQLIIQVQHFYFTKPIKFIQYIFFLSFVYFFNA